MIVDFHCILYLSCDVCDKYNLLAHTLTFSKVLLVHVLF